MTAVDFILEILEDLKKAAVMAEQNEIKRNQEQEK